MKKIFSLIVISFIISFFIMGCNIVDAAGCNISATSKEVKIGESVKINVNFIAAAWELAVSGNGISEDRYVGYTEDLSEKNTSKSISLNTSSEGTYTITLKGTITDENGTTTKIDKSTTVKVIKPETPATPSTPGTNVTPSTDNTSKKPTTEVKKSIEARLKNLGITPNDFKGFKKDKYEYTTTVPNNVSEVEVYAELVDAKASVKGTGKVSLKEGANTVEIKVTAEDGKTTKTYKLTINRRNAEEENAVQSETRLSNLGIKPEEYDFEGFDKDKTEYSVEIPNNVNEIEVYAEAINSNCQITGTGIITLEEGDNTLSIDVISENGNKKTYTIKVNRTKNKEENKVKFGLSSLSIMGLNLNPQFKNNVYEYTIELTEDISQLEIIPEKTDSNTEIEIIGNENLQNGENVITILVKKEDTAETVTYQIIVNKNVAEKEIVMSWLKPSTWRKEEFIKIAIIIVLIILLIIAIILKIQIGKEDNKNNEIDFPGADELDKAIAEHQELAEGEIDNNEDVSKSDFDVKEKRKGRHF